MKKFRGLCRLLVGVLLFGTMHIACGANGPLFRPIAVSNLQRDEGILYVYRPKKIVGSAMPFVLKTGAEDRKLPNGSYQAYILPAGNYSINRKLFQWFETFVIEKNKKDESGWTHILDFVVRPAGATYIKMEPGFGKNYQVMDNRVAEQEIVELYLSPITEK